MSFGAKRRVSPRVACSLGRLEKRFTGFRKAVLNSNLRRSISGERNEKFLSKSSD